jgi:hypothetical protein
MYASFRPQGRFDLHINVSSLSCEAAAHSPRPGYMSTPTGEGMQLDVVPQHPETPQQRQIAVVTV